MIILGKWEKNGQHFSIEKAGASGKTLLSILREKQIYVDAPCNGKGTCGGCRVRYLEGAPEPSSEECRLLSEPERNDGIRLACKSRPGKDCSILILDRGGEKIYSVTETEQPQEMKQPHKITLTHETEPRHEMGQLHGTEQPNTELIGNRKSAQSFRKIKVNRKTKDIRKSGVEEKSAAGYGIAIDIGTTTLAAELFALSTGAAAAVTTAVNHQRACGADVISRIFSANEGNGKLLRESICSDLRKMLGELIAKSGIASDCVVKIAISGNTTMCHLLLGYSCETLGTAPFIPVNTAMQTREWQEIFGTEELRAKVTVLPGISAFVGADIVTGIYRCGMDLQEEVSMLLDIGTNGEMVIGNRNGFLVTSAAAGPVFEGGNISCGIPGIPGAITHVTLQQQQEEDRVKANGEFACRYKPHYKTHYKTRYETIEGKSPTGLCGTGIIDLVSELVREHLVDENGTLAEPWFERGFPVAGEEILFLQNDIREIQMAKSAIRAGVETLIQEYGEQPVRVYLAGGFGHFMDVEKAVKIGLFPESFLGQVTAVGNSSLDGAKRFLLEERAAERLQWIAGHAGEINLAMHPKFNDLYLQHMFFEGA